VICDHLRTEGRRRGWRGEGGVELNEEEEEGVK